VVIFQPNDKVVVNAADPAGAVARIAGFCSRNDVVAWRWF